MSTICPKDGRSCIDDVCRGSGICAVTRTELWDQCQRCHGVYSYEFDVDCACNPDYDDSEDADAHAHE